MRAGTARADITPDRPICMAGYAARTGKSEGVYRNLFAKALVLEEGDQRVAVIATDLIGFDPATCDAVKTAVTETTGLNPDQVILSATHTHTGPEMRLRSNSYVDEFDEGYVRGLILRLGVLVAEAAQALEPVTLDFSKASCTLGVNRRLFTPGGVQMRPNPAGLTDPEVSVLRALRPDGSPLAVLMSYACHPTTLGGYLIGGDYPGFAQDEVEAAFENCTALFMLGCAGDIKVRHVDGKGAFLSGPHQAAQSLGQELARAALLAVGHAPRTVEGPMRCRLGDVGIPYGPPPTRKEAEEMAAQQDELRAKWGREMLRIHDAGEEFARSKPMAVHILRIGDFVLVGFAAEMCVGYALRLKRELGDVPAVIAGYTNGMIGYVPTAAMIPEGGYEVNRSFYAGLAPAPYALTAEDAICAATHEMLARR